MVVGSQHVRDHYDSTRYHDNTKRALSHTCSFFFLESMAHTS
jgi:hypothetical protein